MSKIAILGYAELENGRVSERTLGAIFFLVFWASKWYPRFLLKPAHVRARALQKRPKNARKGVVQEKVGAVLGYLELEDARVLGRSLGTIFRVISRGINWYLG